MAIEIPHRVKRHLGLKDDPQWIVIDETNRFTWPGPDLRRIPQIHPGQAQTGQAQTGQNFAYGMMPGALFKQVRDAFVARARERRDHPVIRDG